jgi:carboxypeptidase family protein
LRLCLFCILLSASLGAQPSPDSTVNAAARTAHLEGQVLSQTGEPLRRASLRLTPYGTSAPNAVGYVDTSDASGNFLFEAVSPGRYTLEAQRTGFMAQYYGTRSSANTYPGSVLALAAGQIMKGLNFNLIPQGVITGRVMDADGDPFPGVRVQVMRMFRGKRGVSPFGGAVTDDQGSFRIAIFPLDPTIWPRRTRSRASSETPKGCARAAPPVA